MLALLVTMSATAAGELGDENFEQLAEKLYYNRPLTPEDEALIRKAAERWGESEVRAAAVIVAAWLEKQGKAPARPGAGEAEGGNPGPGAESGLDLKLITFLAIVGAVELAILIVYFVWWRRRRSRPPPWLGRPDGPDGPSSASG